MKDARFTELVRAVVRKIPKGETRTYGDIAREAGNAGAARAVGAIMKQNYDPTVPCHRVIRADGTCGGYNRGGPSVKYSLITAERKDTRK